MSAIVVECTSIAKCLFKDLRTQEIARVKARRNLFARVLFSLSDRVCDGVKVPFNSVALGDGQGRRREAKTRDVYFMASTSIGAWKGKS